jgi:hypothetical protein
LTGDEVAHILQVLPHEKLYLDHLPDTDRYYKSFMHRDVINFCVMTKCVLLCARIRACRNDARYSRTEFLITTSVDGHLKLWKKQDQGIEFVKHYRAHLAPVVAVSASADGQLFASVAEDGSAKVFDVINFGEAPSVSFLHPHLSASQFDHVVADSKTYARHDQHAYPRLQAPCVLLGPPPRPGAGTPRHVRVLWAVAAWSR